MSADDKLEKATQDVQKMEKHFNSAIMYMTEALTDKAKEIEAVKGENEYYRQMASVLYITTFASYCIGYLVARFVSC